MSSSSSTRLERALELYCEHQQRGGDVRELMQQNPDLADLLASFVDETPPAESIAVAGFPPDFEPVREIGRGGSGVVYEARQLSLDRRVALKMLHESFASSPASLARFHREAQLLARLDHPGIVRVHAASTVASRPWLAMEFVDGESLAVHLMRLRESGHQGGSMRRLVAVVAQVAEALHHAHTQGIVHRDVKPSNILLRDGEQAVLGDFGLARDADAPGLTRTGIAAGTPYYMAPERILDGGGDTDARSDVYSLGLTLYECLALRRAFDGASSQEVLQKILTSDPPDIRRIAPGVPADLAAVVHKAIEREPARRYADADAFAQDLRAFLDLRPIQARPISRARRLARYARRRPMAMATLVVGACGLLFAIILAVQWPEVRAAELTRRNDRIEDELVLATLARSRADFADCIRHFRQAIELGPERSEAIAGLCLAIYYGEGAERALQESERHPGTQHLLRVRAFLLGELGRKDEALAISTRLGEPRDWIELWLTAVPLAREGAAAADLHHADQLLTRAILVEPRPRLWLHVQFAALQVLRRDDDGRRLAAEALLTVWPDNPRAKAIAGTCLLTSDPHRAAELLAGSFDDSGHDALNRVNLGFALALARRPGEGAAEMERAMGDSNLTDAHRVRVLQVLHMIAEYDREKRLAEEWLSRQPDNVSAKWFVARTTARSGGTARALQLFRECVEAAPANFDVRLDYALGLQMAGELDEAVVQAKRVAEQQPGLERAHDLLVDLYRLRNDGEAVIAELERWVGKEPENAKSWRCLAGEYLRRDGAGDTARALDAAERSVRLTKGRDTEALGMHADALEHHGDTAAAARLRAQIAALKPTEPKR